MVLALVGDSTITSARALCSVKGVSLV